MAKKWHNILLQLHKGGSSTTTVQSYQPTPEERALMAQALKYSEAVAPNALSLNTTAKDLLYGNLGEMQIDYNKLTQDAQQQLAQAQQGFAGLAQGKLPAEYQANMENSIRSGVESTMGSLVNNLGARGVLNSSVTNTAMNDISKNASDTMAQQYANNIGMLGNIYGNQANLAGQNITLSAAAQEAAQQPAINLWNASMGLNSNGTLGALAGVAGKGTSTTTQNMSGGGNMFGSIMGGLAGGIGGALPGIWACFTDDTKIKTDEGDKLIRHISVGDTVTAIDTEGNEFKDVVIETLEPRITDVYVVTTKGANNNKGAVSTTLTQPLMLESGEWKDVAFLRIGEVLKGLGKVTGIVYSGERKVYDLKLKRGVGYYANGVIAKAATTEW